MTTLAENLRAVREAVSGACARSGRNEHDVRIIAVSKTMGIGKVREAIDAGLDTFGENYVQEAMEKIRALPSEIRWHFIGNIQKNKVRHIVRSFELIHSVGSREIAAEIDRRAQQAGHVQPVLFEINIAGETTKSGFSPGGFSAALEFLSSLKNIRPAGLMTMPTPTDNETELSGYFAAVHTLRDTVADRGIFGGGFRELSMGTSSDYKIAIIEGATMIRIGTLLFGPRG